MGDWWDPTLTDDDCVRWVDMHDALDYENGEDAIEAASAFFEDHHIDIALSINEPTVRAQVLADFAIDAENEVARIKEAIRDAAKTLNDVIIA